LILGRRASELASDNLVDARQEPILLALRDRRARRNVVAPTVPGDLGRGFAQRHGQVDSGRDVCAGRARGDLRDAVEDGEPERRSTKIDVSFRRPPASRSRTLASGSKPTVRRKSAAASGRPERPRKYGSIESASAFPSGRSRRASRRSGTTTLRSLASSKSAAFTPTNPPSACLSPIAPAIAGPARSQFRSSRTRAKSHVVVAPHISRAPSTPKKCGFTWAILSESRIGLWWSRTTTGYGRPSRRSS